VLVARREDSLGAESPDGFVATPFALIEHVIVRKCRDPNTGSAK
jgi:hypothetical protein